jgi:glutamate-1-semialdehyde 2,1-aminomutase
VRFAKNGSDVTSAAIRLSRAFTGKDNVIVCGYHGWQDWYIGSTTMNLGVPNATRSLTYSIEYNNIESLTNVIEQLQGNVAAIIMEPMTSTWPDETYLPEVRRIATEHGIVLVFDEMLTGFRFAPGGAQEYFGVTPDLAAFGKALANGFPLSAIVGRADILDLMPQIFFSGTFGGETLSLTAARVVLGRMKSGEPAAKLAALGKNLLSKVEQNRPEESRNFLNFSGHDSWIFQQWSIEDPERLAQAKTLLLQEMLRRGVLLLNTHDVTTAFTDYDLETVSVAYSESLALVVEGLAQDDLMARLECEPIRPLFRVRS